MESVSAIANVIMIWMVLMSTLAVIVLQEYTRHDMP